MEKLSKGSTSILTEQRAVGKSYAQTEMNPIDTFKFL